jgi:hypothetical protein
MTIKYKEVILKPRQMGISLEDTEAGKIGRALFEKVPGSGQFEEFEVKAVEYIRKNHELWVVDTENGVTEHTPQEVKFEDIEGVPHRVTAEYPLPVDGAIAYPASVSASAAGTTLVKAPSSGKKLRVKYIEVFNSGVTSITVDLRFTATGTAYFKKNLAPQTGFNANLIGGNWLGGKDEGFYINLSADGSVECTIMYMEE